MHDAISHIEIKDILLVLMGSAFTIIAFLYKILQEYFEKYKLVTPMLGTWYTYHFTRANFKPIFRKEKWQIKRSLFGLSIETSDEARPGLRYKGHVSFDSSYVALYLRGDAHPEVIQYKLTQPIPNESTVMIGFHVGKDFNHELYSTIKLACNKEIPDEEAKKS